MVSFTSRPIYHRRELPGNHWIDEWIRQIGRFSPFLWATQALSVSRGIALHFSRTFSSRWGWGVSSTLRPHLLPGKTRYPLYRRLGGPQGRYGRAENLFPPGFDPGPSRPQSVAIPTELPGPQVRQITGLKAGAKRKISSYCRAASSYCHSYRLYSQQYSGEFDCQNM